MRIDYTYFSHAVPLLRDKVLIQLTDQQKKILVVASIAFACLALCCLLTCRYACSKIEKEEDDFDDSDDSKKVKIDAADSKKPEEDDFDDSKLNGPAAVKFPNGTVANGEFTDGMLHGKGEKILVDGTIE